jgi:hypothetical protein
LPFTILDNEMHLLKTTRLHGFSRERERKRDASLTLEAVSVRESPCFTVVVPFCRWQSVSSVSREKDEDTARFSMCLPSHSFQFRAFPRNLDKPEFWRIEFWRIGYTFGLCQERPKNCQEQWKHNKDAQVGGKMPKNTHATTTTLH